MSSLALPPPVDCFQLAWGLATAAGLARPAAPVIPDPVIAAHDERGAWLLARVQSEVVGFQQAVGNWTQAEPLAPKALSHALGGLRRSGRGPTWWRQWMAPWRRREAEQWRGELVDELQRIRRSEASVSKVLESLRFIRQGLDRWSAWADEVLPAPAGEHWQQRRGMYEATLEVLAQRLTVRHQLEQSQLAALQQALELVDMVRHARGANEDRVWGEAADKASRALREMKS